MRSILSSPQGAVARHLMVKGRRVQTRAKQLCRVDTGRLRSSITVTPVTVGDEFVVHVGTNVEYAVYLEARYPFLRPALAAAQT